MGDKLEKFILIPTNLIQLNLYTNRLELIQVEKKLTINIPIFICLDLKFDITSNLLNLKINKNFKQYTYSKILFFTFYSILKNKINGLIKFYEGSVNLIGFNYRIEQCNQTELIFWFGLKKKKHFFLPKNVFVENILNKTKLIISSFDINLLKSCQISIQRLHLPRVYKLKGIYLNEIYPKIKKYVK